MGLARGCVWSSTHTIEVARTLTQCRTPLRLMESFNVSEAFETFLQHIPSIMMWEIEGFVNAQCFHLKEVSGRIAKGNSWMMANREIIKKLISSGQEDQEVGTNRSADVFFLLHLLVTSSSLERGRSSVASQAPATDEN